MGIFGRMKTLLKSNVNDLASKAEDPERILNQLILDMQDQLKQAKLEVRDTITDKKRLKKQLDAALEESAKWEKKAMTAVKADRDDLAREALSRKAEADSQAAEYQSNHEQLAANSDQLVESLRRLNDKIEEAKRKKASLVARVQRVDAQNTMATTAHATSNTSAFDAFEANAAKIDDFEASVSATAELTESLGNTDLDAKFSKLEEKHAADDELAALKAKMGMS